MAGQASVGGGDVTDHGPPRRHGVGVAGGGAQLGRQRIAAAFAGRVGAGAEDHRGFRPGGVQLRRRLLRLGRGRALRPGRGRETARPAAPRHRRCRGRPGGHAAGRAPAPHCPAVPRRGRAAMAAYSSSMGRMVRQLAGGGVGAPLRHRCRSCSTMAGPRSRAVAVDMLEQVQAEAAGAVEQADIGFLQVQQIAAQSGRSAPPAPAARRPGPGRRRARPTPRAAAACSSTVG